MTASSVLTQYQRIRTSATAAFRPDPTAVMFGYRGAGSGPLAGHRRRGERGPGDMPQLDSVEQIA